jgi:hypothetical protein
MIEAGSYKKNAKVWKDHMFPVMDHFFANGLNKGSDYKLGTLLWQIMVDSKDMKGADAITEFAWSSPIKNQVAAELERFKEPAGLKVDPESAAVSTNQETSFQVMYVNRAEIPVEGVQPGLKSEVTPAGAATIRQEGDKFIVKGAKGGGAKGTLIVRDEKRGLEKQVPLVFQGKGMSKWWPIGGLAVTGGAAGGAAATDGGTSTALWATTGVAALGTFIIAVQYFRGGKLPLMGQSEPVPSDTGLAYRIVPGPRSIELNIRF